MSWFDDIGDWIEDTADDVADVAEDVVDAVGSTFEEAKSYFDEHGTWLMDRWDVFDPLAQHFADGINSIPATLDDALPYAADFVKDLGDALTDPGLYANLSEGVFGAVDALEDAGNTAAWGLNEGLNGYIDGIGTAAYAAQDAAFTLKETFERLMRTTSDFVYQYSRVLTNALAESVMPGGSWLMEKMWSLAAEQVDYFSPNDLAGFLNDMSKANFLPAFNRMVYQTYQAVADAAKSGALEVAAGAYGATRSVANVWQDGQFEALGGTLRSSVEGAFRTVLGEVTGALPAIVDTFDDLGRQTKALVLDPIATNMTPSQLMLLSRMGITELQVATNVLRVPVESALAAAIGGVKLVSQEGVTALVDGAQIAQLGAAAIESIALAGVKTITAGATNGASFGVDTMNAIVDNGIELAANRFIQLLDEGEKLADLSVAAIAELGRSGVDAVVATSEWTMDQTTAAALATAGVAVQGAGLVRVAITENVLGALPQGDLILVVTTAAFADVDQIADLAKRGLEIASQAVRVVYEDGGALFVQLDPRQVTVAFADEVAGLTIDAVGRMELTFVDAVGEWGLAAAGDGIDALAQTVIDYAARDIHRIYTDVTRIALTPAFIDTLVEAHSSVFSTVADKLVTIVADGGMLGATNLGAWAAAGVQAVDHGLSEVMVTIDQAVAAAQSGLAFVGDGVVKAAIHAETVGSLTADKVAALATSGVDEIVAATDVTVDFATAQVLAAKGITLTGLDQATAYVAVARDALEYASPDSLEAMIDHGMKYVLSEGVTYALMANDKVKDLTGENLQEIALHAGRIYLTRGELGLALAVMEKIASYDTPISGPLGTVVKVLDSAAILTSLNKASLVKLAAVGVTALVANEGLPTVDLGFGFNLADLSMKMLSTDKIVRLADNVLKLSDVSVGDLKRLADVGITAVVATGGDLVVSAQQAAGYAANGVSVALDTGRHGIVDAGAAISETLAAIKNVPWVDTIRVGGDAVIDLAQAGALAASTYTVTLAEGASLAVQASAGAFDAIDAEALVALAAKGMDRIDVAGTLVALVGDALPLDAAAMQALLQEGVESVRLLGSEAIDLGAALAAARAHVPVIAAGGTADVLADGTSLLALRASDIADLVAAGMTQAIVTVAGQVSGADVARLALAGLTVSAAAGIVAQASADALSLAEDATARGNLLANDFLGHDGLRIASVEGRPLVAGQAITLASGALLTIAADGSYAYDPNGAWDALVGARSRAANATGQDGFDYTLADGTSAHVAITVRGVTGPGDVLRGDAGDNRLIGAAAGETFDLSQGGSDVVSGGGGGDRFLFGDAFGSSDRIDGGDGADALVLDGAYVLRLGANVISVERLTLLGASTGQPNGYDLMVTDVVVAAGATLTVDGSALGAAEALLFNGQAERDGTFTLIGGAAADRLIGGTGNDRLDGGAGADELRGGAGNDTYLIDNAKDGVIERAGGGNDQVLAYVDYTLAPTAEVETLRVAGTDGLWLTGNRMSNMIIGGAGVDVLDGNAGDDLLFAVGGGDTLIGGSGADRFWLRSTADADGVTIADFVRRSGDLIDLSRIDANSVTAGDQAFSWIAGKAFSGHAGELRGSYVDGHLLVMGDTNGDAVADFTLYVEGVRQLTPTDFVL